jgi:hypothetical protein
LAAKTVFNFIQIPNTNMKTLTTHHLSFHHTLSSTHNSFSFLSLSPTFPKPSSTTKKITAQKPNHNNNGSIRVKGKKENVWSVDNDLAKASSSQKEKKERGRKKMVKRNKGKKGGRVIVTGAMLMEVETVLQTQVTFFFPSGFLLNCCNLCKVFVFWFF